MKLCLLLRICYITFHYTLRIVFVNSAIISNSFDRSLHGSHSSIFYTTSSPPRRTVTMEIRLWYYSWFNKWSQLFSADSQNTGPIFLYFVWHHQPSYCSRSSNVLKYGNKRYTELKLSSDVEKKVFLYNPLWPNPRYDLVNLLPRLNCIFEV